MLYSRRPEPPQIRTRCRNPRCASELKIPAANPRDAFCCKSCEVRFYSRHCRVCEALFSPKTQRRTVCWRSRCRHEFQRYPERFCGGRYPTPGLGHNGRANPIKIGVETGGKSDRGWVVIAGPAEGLDPINLRAHPTDIAAMRTGRSGPVLFTRSTPPTNVVVGYRFPNAPKVDLFGESGTCTDQEGTP